MQGHTLIKRWISMEIVIQIRYGVDKRLLNWIRICYDHLAFATQWASCQCREMVVGSNACGHLLYTQIILGVQRSQMAQCRRHGIGHADGGLSQCAAVLADPFYACFGVLGASPLWRNRVGAGAPISPLGKNSIGCLVGRGGPISGEKTRVKHESINENGQGQSGREEAKRDPLRID
jgi:hypothetical protein